MSPYWNNPTADYEFAEVTLLQIRRYEFGPGVNGTNERTTEP